jgi:methionine synthase II (cobalamin-independent)
MFATLLGGLPRPRLDGRAGDSATIDELVTRAVEAQDAAGLEPITDGRLRWRGFAGPLAGLGGLEGLEDLARRNGPAGNGSPTVTTPTPRWRAPLSVDAWRFAAAATSKAVKQALPGPYTLARRLAAEPSSAAARTDLTLALADATRSEALALAEAGCLFVEIEERDAGKIGEDEAERRLFRDAHLALTDGVAGLHLSLAIVGGNADTAGIEAILAAPYPSLALDLIDGPDNWRLARAAPGDRGIVAGALSPHHPSDDGPELLLWAAGYAASMNGRGPDRVGLAIAGSLAGLSWDIAVRKMARLGEAARLAAAPPRDAARRLDPRAVNTRSAALGRVVPARAPRRRRPA